MMVKDDFGLNSQLADLLCTKAEYASIPLLILALAVIKWSNCAFIRKLSPSTYHQMTALTLAVVVGLWLVSSAVAGLLQCALPTPWDTTDAGRCIDRVSRLSTPSTVRHC